MTEKSEGLVQERSQPFGKGLDKGRELGEGRFRRPSAPTGELNRADFDIRGKSI